MEHISKLYEEAKMVAIKAHGSQSYDEIFPYEKHLEDVVSVIKRFGYAGRYIISGYLHDSIEDGDISYRKIKSYFGKEVAEIVYCVTDEQGRDRKEKKLKTLPKTASNESAIIVKLADRIANIEHGGKVKMYKKEYKQFCKYLRHEDQDVTCKAMWEYLDELLGVKNMI